MESSKSTTQAIINLIALGISAASLYLLAFTQPYSLFEHGHKLAQTIGTLGNQSFESAVRYLASLGALFAAYWFGYRHVLRPLSSRPGWNRRMAFLILGFGLLFNLVLLPVYPFNAVDIYENILRGRISAVYHLNPFVATPQHIPNDPFYPYSVFRSYTSPYGPLWETFAGLASRIAGDGYLTNLFIFKAVSIAGYLTTAALIGLALRKLAPNRQLTGMYLFAWNPLVILMTGGAGHNDPVMTAFMLLSVYFLVQRRYSAASLAAIAGGLVKFIPFMLVPLIAILAWRNLPRAGLWVYLGKTAVLGLLLFVLAYAPYLPAAGQAPPGAAATNAASPALQFVSIRKIFVSYMIARRSETFTGSVATLARQFLAPSLDGQRGDAPPERTPHSSRLVANLTLAIFAACYLVQAVQVYRRPEPYFAARAWLKILVVYLLAATVWFQIWYVIWLVALAALLDDTRLQRLALLFSYLVTFQPYLYNFVTLRPGHWAPVPWRDLLPVLASMGGAAIYLVASTLTRRRPAHLKAKK
jgi:hypothetical protein